MVGNMGAAMINGFQQGDFTGNSKSNCMCKAPYWWWRINQWD